ncbi:hypothetical protein VPNG_06141 [Cytospora leucostoma]|uniref:Uncharacterized protein n=1 Tax=Cytospora leucostoma TaxID=1230097 RepID=A0A423WYD8_9PEZI|nr:hypothetical protein VPNG_06141 [Cytospora leucostoma]
MDGPFVAANTAALAAAARSVQIATDFLREVPAAQDEVEPVLAELCDLRGILECLQNVTLPDPLFAPLTRVVRAAPDAVPITSPPSPPTTPPSVQSMMFSFRRLALGFSDPGQTRPSSTISSETDSGCEISTQSLLASIPDEDLTKHPGFGQRYIKPSPLPLNNAQYSPDTGRPLPAYSLFPSPPPARSLPPLPPPKSGLRRNPLLSSAGRAPQVPVKSRARAVSSGTHDARFTTSSDAASNRHSTTSNLSLTKLPPLSSSDTYEQSLYSLQHTLSTASEDIGIDVTPLRRIDPIDKDSAYGVYSIETSPTSTNLASRHGKSCVNIWEVQSGYTLISTIKVPFYVQAQPRSRDNFIRSHAILSEALNLVAITSCFGHTLEVWNWAKRKKVQSLSDVYRWAYTRQPQAGSYPLAAYREDRDTIDLYPASPSTTSKKPFGKPRSIDLRKAGLPHLPKLPELAYSATGPLLVAAAGPRPPRPDCPPPEHAALLMAWQLGDDASAPVPHTPYKSLMPDRARYPELENSLPLCLATYGSVAVSVWSAARFRTIGRPGAWQVEPVAVTERSVLVWDFGGAEDGGSCMTYRIPDVLSCVSPDCRFVAYCDPGGGGSGARAGGLVVLDATSGRELWRMDGKEVSSDGASGRRSGRSSLRSGVDGGISVYEVKEGIGIGVNTVS